MKHEEAVTKQTIAKRMNIIARLNFVVFGAAGVLLFETMST